MFMNSSSPTLSNDLSNFKDLISLLADPSAVDKLITDLQTRVTTAKEAEDNASKAIIDAKSLSDQLDARSGDLDKQEKTLSDGQASLDGILLSIKQREDALVSNTVALDSQSKALNTLQTQILTDQGIAQQDLNKRISDAQVALDAQTAAVQKREIDVTTREQVVAVAQADLDSWKTKVASAAAIVATVGKS